MSHEDVVRRAFRAFASDAETHPALSLRGASAVDSYALPEPFDPTLDRPTDAYLEQHASFGLFHLDAPSWRHYLPRLVEYALRVPHDPRMAVETLLATLRPPDRYPPRLATLTAAQEEVVCAFLEIVALGAAHGELAEVAQRALEEWWLPGAHARPSDDEVAELRAAPLELRSVVRERFRLSLPSSFGSSGARDVPTESRRVEVWRGLLCGDAPAVVAVNVTPSSLRTLGETLARAAGGLGADSVPATEARVCDKGPMETSRGRPQS